MRIQAKYLRGYTFGHLTVTVEKKRDDWIYIPRITTKNPSDLKPEEICLVHGLNIVMLLSK